MDLKTKLSSYIDFACYIFLLKRKEVILFFMSLIFFTVAAITLTMDLKSLLTLNLSFSLLLLLSLAQFVWNFYGIVSSFRKYTMQSNLNQLEEKESLQVDTFLIKDLTLSDREKEMSFTKLTHVNQTLAYSPSVDKAFWDNIFSLEVNNAMRSKIKAILKNNEDKLANILSYKFFSSMKKDRYFYNEDKLCLSSDIDIDNLKVICHKGSYYDSFLTNEICTKVLVNKETGDTCLDGRVHFPAYFFNHEIKLFDITRSEMNNHIGISTLAVTEDNYLVLWVQNYKTQHNRNMYVPTATGSCNWSDLSGKSFSQTVVNAMHRELWEECTLKNTFKSLQEVGSTKITGFFRWINRGGKPEFTGITRLNCRYNNILPCKKEVRTPARDMEKYTHFYYINDISALHDAMWDIKSRSKTSIPLIMCINNLERFLSQRKEELTAFLLQK